ncbi:MAG: ABC transporter substrate-binding protein, partial [Deltaproteobacteria bacterium]|nr:ABC transporter substrate-binding protein [Deltaproteobacteria bacterium]
MINFREHGFFKISVLFSLLFFSFCSQSFGEGEKTLSWDKAVRDARGQTVDWYMWGGSPAVNRYVNGFLAGKLKEKYDITLRQVPVKDIAEVVSKLVVEKQAGKESDGNVDLMWINGENFRTCKSKELLYGPFAEKLPNIKYVDRTAPAVMNDFGTPVEDMESPWGSAQFVMIYDTARISRPPKSVPALISWVRNHPGRFTYPAPPDFTGSVFVRHFFYHAAENVEKWQKNYTDDEFQQAADATYAQLLELKPFLWQKGATYPESPVRMNTLFADGVIDFSFSYHQGEASRNILDGLFPDTVRTYVFDGGTIGNTHFVAIPFNAGDKAAAMVTANYLLSPEAQLAKADPETWGDFPVIKPELLPKKWQQQFLEQSR